MALTAKSSVGDSKTPVGGSGAQFGAHGAKLGVLETKLGALGTEMGCMVPWGPTFGSGSQNEGTCLDQWEPWALGLKRL